MSVGRFVVRVEGVENKQDQTNDDLILEEVCTPHVK